MKKASDCVIISGGPSVGKTTIIRGLRRMGQPVINEVGSVVIRQGQYHPGKDRHAFQTVVKERQLKVEARRRLGELCYCDRGLLDGAAYFLIDGYAVPPEFFNLHVSHYLVCFLLEPLDFFEHDGIRCKFEDLEFTRRITPLLEQVYRAAGVPVVRVPNWPVEERLDFILTESNRLWKAARPATVYPTDGSLVLA